MGCKSKSLPRFYPADYQSKKCEKWRALADFSQYDSHRHISCWPCYSKERRWDFFVFWWWRRGEGNRKRWYHGSLDCYNNWWLLHPYNKISFAVCCSIIIMYLFKLSKDKMIKFYSISHFPLFLQSQRSRIWNPTTSPLVGYLIWLISSHKYRLLVVIVRWK